MNTAIDITLQTPFRIGDWHAEPGSGRLRRQGVEVKLEPKVMQVLVCLAQNPGVVVSREALESTVWAGTVVGYDAISGSIIKLRKALGDDSRNPRYIETISKKGYRLIADVSRDVSNEAGAKGGATAEDVEPAGSRTPEFVRTRNRSVKGQLVLAVTGLIIIIAGWRLLDTQPDQQTQSGSEPSTENPASHNGSSENSDIKPSVVVLPFKNLSDDPQQEYFSDGITDDIITDLSQVGSLRVIARQSAYYYKHKTGSLDDVARDFNVQYIIEGSVQKAGKRIRINAQLTDVESGHHLWAERFDRELNDVFAIQDEIARHVIDAMFVTLSEQENKRVLYRTTNNFEAYDAFLRGLQQSKNRTKEGHELTKEAFQRALELDPHYARVYGAMAVTLIRGYRFQWSDLSMQEAQERALRLAKKAVALDQSTPQIYWSLGFVHLFRKEYEQAETATMQSIKLSPNYADGYGLLAFINNWRGNAEQAERYIKKAMALNPYYPFDYPWNLGLAYYHMGKYKQAATALKNALERNESVLLPRLFLAASYVRLGRVDDAQWEIEQVAILRPDTTITHLANTLPYESKERMNAFLEDLRDAGLPE
ncbi:MAG: winged helix-turn-helix domain-containing protein [Gammaproteobacteria bacterium]|jgi:TolB-like protein/DNA-binding winged helix-turn-helix (wHTH) protein